MRYAMYFPSGEYFGEPSHAGFGAVMLRGCAFGCASEIVKRSMFVDDSGCGS